MKMYVKPSINVIELQLKENIAAVPTTVYKGKKGSMKINEGMSGDLNLTALETGLTPGNYAEYGGSIL
ncbi:MAG: hypothetical protein IJB50_01295 [Clostridia bacterium]|nr:hypothetical protein [Clostridia bacterium]